jgi:hypothetical protein
VKENKSISSKLPNGPFPGIWLSVMSAVTEGSTTKEHQRTILMERAKLLKPKGFSEAQVSSFVDDAGRDAVRGYCAKIRADQEGAVYLCGHRQNNFGRCGQVAAYASL